MKSYLQSFRHYKGGTYTLLYIAENSMERSEEMAVYVSHARRKVLVQPAQRFFEHVKWPDGVWRPRFDLLDDETPTTPDV